MLWSDSPFFVFGKSQVGRLHSKSRILRLVPRSNTRATHKVWQYPPPSQNHSACVRHVGARIERSQRDKLSAECHFALLAIEGVGIFPLTILRQNAKPLVRHLLRG